MQTHLTDTSRDILLDLVCWVKILISNTIENVVHAVKVDTLEIVNNVCNGSLLVTKYTMS